MLLTLTTTHQPATDLGYLLGKHPGKIQTFELNAGQARIFYTEASESRCTAVLLAEIDPVALVRKEGNDAFALDQYVNDRPYVASSYLAQAIAKCYSGALNGHSKDRPELVQKPIPLEATVAVVSARGGEALLRRLFEPLGYEMDLTHHPLDEQFPEWGQSRYFTMRLRHTLPLSALLSHLYVLLPVADTEKHYYISEEERDKLLKKGGDWLPAHPECEMITRRYLKNKAHLTKPALEILLASDNEVVEEDHESAGEKETPKFRLHDLRLEAVRDMLLRKGAKTVLDLGCGEGRLLRLLMEHRQFTRIVGMDVETRSLEIASRRLKLDRLLTAQKERITLLQGSLLYCDKRLEGFDAAAIVEVIEHLDPARLATFGQVVFGQIKPGIVVLTTPNAEYNEVYGMDEGKMRHSDHRFEWTRAEFEQWTQAISEKFRYQVEIFPVGEPDQRLGAPSQMAVFSANS